jgi:hypothetical protein
VEVTVEVAVVGEVTVLRDVAVDIETIVTWSVSVPIKVVVIVASITVMLVRVWVMFCVVVLVCVRGCAIVFDGRNDQVVKAASIATMTIPMIIDANRGALVCGNNALSERRYQCRRSLTLPMLCVVAREMIRQLLCADPMTKGRKDKLLSQGQTWDCP